MNVVAVVVPDTLTFCRKVAFVLVLMLSVTAIPASADPETRMVRNLDIESRKVQMAIGALRDFQTNDLVAAMRAEPKDDKETSTAADQTAGKDAEATGTFDVSKVAQKLYQATKWGITKGGTDEKAIHDALSSITTPAQYDQVNTLFKRYYKKGDIEFMIKDEMSGNDLKKAQDIIAKIKSSGEKETEPKTTKTEPATTSTTAKDLGDGKVLFPMPTDGDWNKVSAALGFKSVTDMVVVQKATGVTDKDGKKLDVRDVLQYPMTYAGKPIVWTKNPATSGVTSNSNSVKSDKEVPSATAKTNGKQTTTPDTSSATTASNQNAGKSAETIPSVEPRPVGSGRNVRGSQLRWDRQYKNTHNPDGTPKNESKEYDMTKKVNEAASMNISMNGDNSAEVAELVALLRNAGMEKAEPVSDMPMYKDKHDDMVSKIQMMDPEQGPMDSPSPCGMGEEDVEEEWDNSPDEEYRDDDYMTRDIAGGLNRPKPPGALRAKDPAIHNEDVDKYKSELRKGLEDLYKTI